jgi:hypothetical protein
MIPTYDTFVTAYPLAGRLADFAPAMIPLMVNAVEPWAVQRREPDSHFRLIAEVVDASLQGATKRERDVQARVAGHVSRIKGGHVAMRHPSGAPVRSSRFDAKTGRRVRVTLTVPDLDVLVGCFAAVMHGGVLHLLAEGQGLRQGKASGETVVPRFTPEQAFGAFKAAPPSGLPCPAMEERACDHPGGVVTYVPGVDTLVVTLDACLDRPEIVPHIWSAFALGASTPAIIRRPGSPAELGRLDGVWVHRRDH